MTEGPRILSLLPSATEMVCALGLGAQLVGVTHECDFPECVRQLPKVVRNALPIETMTQREIDVAVSARLRSGQSLYRLDVDLIKALRPDIIITQSLCDVCAPSTNDLGQLLAQLHYRPRVLIQTPSCLADMLDCVEELGRELDCEAAAHALVEDACSRLDRIALRAAAIGERRRVFCMEWLDPVYCSGHWVPEMVRIAGGADLLGRAGRDSARVDWDDVIALAPEILLFMPCGYDLENAMRHGTQLAGLRGFHDLPAVRGDRVFALDANGYFARPGPRLISGTEIIAHLLHPDHFHWSGRKDAFDHLRPSRTPDRTPMKASAS